MMKDSLNISSSIMALALSFIIFLSLVYIFSAKDINKINEDDTKVRKTFELTSINIYENNKDKKVKENNTKEKEAAHKVNEIIKTQKSEVKDKTHEDKVIENKRQNTKPLKEDLKHKVLKKDNLNALSQEKKHVKENNQNLKKEAVLKKELITDKSSNSQIFNQANLKSKETYSQHKDKSIKDLINKINSIKQYPKQALKRGLQGTCELSFKVSKNGTILEYTLLKSSGEAILDAACRRIADKILKDKIYKPQEDISIEVPVNYTLRP